MPIRQDAEGNWHAEVCVRRRRLHRRLPEGASKSDAKQLEAELRTALVRDRQPNIAGDPPLTEVMALYMSEARHLESPETAKYHALRIGQWITGRRASEAKAVASDIITDLRDTYAVATINKSLSTLREACRLAFDKGKTAQHYGAAIKRLPEHNAREVFLTLAQVRKLADHASEAMRPFLWIAVFTGLRRREILTLTPDSIGHDSLMVRAANAKTRKMRTVPVISAVRPWLKMVPLDLTMEGVKSAFRRAREAAGMPHVQFRDLRRSCGSLLVQQGVDIYVVSRILGHSSVITTQKHYAHLQLREMRAGLKTLDGLHRDLHRKPRRAA